MFLELQNTFIKCKGCFCRQWWRRNVFSYELAKGNSLGTWALVPWSVSFTVWLLSVWTFCSNKHNSTRSVDSLLSGHKYKSAAWQTHVACCTTYTCDNDPPGKKTTCRLLYIFALSDTFSLLQFGNKSRFIARIQIHWALSVPLKIKYPRGQCVL